MIKSGTSKNMPTQSSMERGLFEIKETIIHNPDGSIKIGQDSKTHWKRSAIFYLIKFLGEEERW